MIYLIIACLVGALLFPVFVNIYLYGDKADGKLGFAFYLFGTFRILSGYAALYTGGIALHLTDKGDYQLLVMDDVGQIATVKFVMQ